MILYFLMAQHNDARPLIAYYGLKKDMSPCPFTVFTAGDVVLCLSGESATANYANTAAATAYLLTRWGRDGLFIHLAPTQGLTPCIFFPHSINYGEDSVYPEMLYKPPPFAIEGHEESGEGLYAFRAAARFLPLKQIIMLRYCNGHSYEGALGWIETIHMAMHPFGTSAFPTSISKKGFTNIP